MGLASRPLTRRVNTAQIVKFLLRISFDSLPLAQDKFTYFVNNNLDCYTPMTYIRFMKFIETSIFTKLIQKLLPDES